MTAPTPFRARIEAARGGGSVVPIPSDVATALGGVRQMRVIGTINKQAFASSTMPYNGVLYLGVHKVTRAEAGIEIGDEVEVTITRDDRPRTLTLAPELEAALAAHPRLRARFDELAFTRRRELADPVAAAKKPDTRMARVERALQALRKAE
jgi:hypothetical protein